ncbi:hypothetical protein RCL1_008161 [Eukaryota sp. TZLM3-RCL]
MSFEHDEVMVDFELMTESDCSVVAENEFHFSPEALRPHSPAATSPVALRPLSPSNNSFKVHPLPFNVDSEVETTEEIIKNLYGKSVKKRNAKAWNHVYYISSNNKESVYCLYCNFNFTSEPDASTISKHCEKSHNERTPDLPKLKSKFLPNQKSIKSFLKFSPGNPEPSTQRSNLVRFVVSKLHKLSIVDEPEFRELVPDLPCRRTLRKWIVEENLQLKQIVIEKLKCLPVKVSLTVDGWTARSGNSFIAVTAHWIEDWKPQQILLCIRQMKSSHTALNSAHLIREVIKEFGLENRVIGITGDNARNMNNALKLLKQSGHVKVVRGCAAHILNLIVSASNDDDEKYYTS